MTLEQYLNDWIVLHCSGGDLKPRTRDSYADLIHRLISPALGASDAALVSPDDIRHLLAGIVEAGHERTAELVYVLLRCALADLDPAIMSHVKRPKHRQKHPVPWSDEQIAVYVAGCADHPHGLAFLLAISVGLRRGEICGLRWRDVDFVANELHIVNQRVRLADGSIIDCLPKSECSVRDIPIPAQLLPRLRREIGHPDAYVCGITPSGLSHAHQKLTRRLGLPHIGLHGLRHSFATSSVKYCGDVRALQSILGHSSYAVTMNIYTHPDHEMKSRAIDAAVDRWYNVLHGCKPCVHLTLNQGVQGSSP